MNDRAFIAKDVRVVIVTKIKGIINGKTGLFSLQK
tara:strand:- start:34 stop:138 length:105 start_codon:yes stop_codon:yes gene_type:complete